MNQEQCRFIVAHLDKAGHEKAGMEFDNTLELREQCKLQLEKTVCEWRRARAVATRNLMEPLVISRAEQEELLLIIFEYAQKVARPSFVFATTYYRQTKPMLLFTFAGGDLLNLWNGATKDVRLENTGALPFGWETRLCDLSFHVEDNGWSYRRALDEAIERRVEVLFASVADEVIKERYPTRPVAAPPPPSVEWLAAKAAIDEVIADARRGIQTLSAQTTESATPREATAKRTAQGRDESPVAPVALASSVKRSGRPGNPERHRRIVDITIKYGKGWPDHLQDVCNNLDAAAIAPRETEHWKETWLATLDQPRGAELIKKAIFASIDAAKKP